MADDPSNLVLSPSTLRTLNKLTLDLVSSANLFGRTISNAFAQAIIEGRRLEDVLRSVGKSLTESLLRSALAPAQNLVTSLITSGATALANAIRGGVGLPLLRPGGSGVTAFADGGVVAAPTYFPMGAGLGLMGERGAEAIMPLARGPDGRLGVQAAEGGGGRPLSVIVQVSTPDAESFRRSEAQVAAAIARAVARGRRAL